MDTHGIAKAELTFILPASKAKSLWIVSVVVIGKVACGYESFAFILLYLNEESEFRHTAYDAVELLPDASPHVLHLLVLYRSPFGIGGYLLHLAAVHAPFLQVVYRGEWLIGLQQGEQTVHHHIGVAADRGGEMGVVIKCQPVVPDVVGGVFGFGHSAHGKDVDHVLLWLSLGAVHQAGDILAGDAIYAAFVGVSEAGGHLAECCEFLGVGFLMHPVHAGMGLVAGSRFPYEFCHGTVGQQHEFLYKPVRFVALFRFYADGHAVWVELESHFV